MFRPDGAMIKCEEEARQRGLDDNVNVIGGADFMPPRLNAKPQRIAPAAPAIVSHSQVRSRARP
jgi:hypothetical protein